MDLTSDPAAPLLPDGARLLHIGPHKTGTTSLQAALWDARDVLREQGVHLAGRSRNPSNAVRAVTGQASPYSDDTPPPIRNWHGLVSDICQAREPRVVVSSEFFSWATPDVIRRIVDELDPARVHVAVTLRPLARIIPSMWQQNVQAGAAVAFDDWVDRLLKASSGAGRPGFWTLHRHDQLIARWADVVGPERITAVVVDDRDHGVVMRVFEQLLGVRAGTLVARREMSNRSLTLPETEAIRAFNVAFKAEDLDRALHARIMRFGAAQQMKAREPRPDEARVELHRRAIEGVGRIQREMIDRIRGSGVRVIGDLELLAELPAGREEALPDAYPVSPEIAAAMTMGVLVSSGAARQASAGPGRFQFAEPVELVRVPTYQVAGVIAIRARNAVLRRARDAGRRVRRAVAER